MITFMTMDSIRDRCSSDVHRFLDLHTCRQEFQYSLERAKTLEEMFAATSRLLDFRSDFGGPDFKYQHISSLPSQAQYQLWLVRTYLFYQLLQYAVQICSGEIVFPFKKMTRLGDVSRCKLGIFGSIGPTSDIDLGIQYSGMLSEPAFVWWIVSLYEKLYLVFCGSPCLDFDIEVYADYVTMPSNCALERGICATDLFYLKTNNFTILHFRKLLPYLGCSILRNAVIAQEELGLGQPKELLRYIAAFDFSSGYYLPDLNFLPNAVQIADVWNESWWKDKARKIIIDSKLHGYMYQRSQYKRRSRAAEVEFLKMKQAYMDTHELEPRFGPDQICRMIAKIARALCYREESYILAPTVVHVVRIIQEKKQPAAKRPCVYPIEARCTMGFYGYLMSLVEQQGYIERFFTTYCIPSDKHYQRLKCDAKYKKYYSRYKNAMLHIKTKS